MRKHPTFFRDFADFCDFFFYYLKKKITRAFFFFEKEKNILVKFFMMKRGRYNRPFLHIATLGVLGLGVLVGPYLSETFPVFGQTASISHVPTPAAKESVTSDDTV